MQEQTQNGPIYDIQRMTIKRRSTTHSKEILSERGWGWGGGGEGGVGTTLLDQKRRSVTVYFVELTFWNVKGEVQRVLLVTGWRPIVLVFCLSTREVVCTLCMRDASILSHHPPPPPPPHTHTHSPHFFQSVNMFFIT